MAQAMMRKSAAGSECRTFSGGKRAAAPRTAAPARRAQQQQQQLVAAARASAAAATTSQLARAAVVARAAATEAAPQQQEAGTQEWHALVANAEFFVNDIQNEALAEQLRERVRYYKEQGKEIDFYFVPNPVWLDAKYPEKGKQVRRPCMALVSTDSVWITFMKLRLDRVLRIDLAGLSKDEALQAGEALPEFKRPELVRPSPYAWYTPGWWKAFYPPGAN